MQIYYIARTSFEFLLLHNTIEHTFLNTMYKLRTAICNACLVHNQLPSGKTSSVSGKGLRFFYTRAENTIFISPRLANGTRAAFIMLEDVCLTVTNAGAQQLRTRVHVHLDSKSGNIIIAYTFDSDVDVTPKTEIRVAVHVCGVLLADVRVCKAFSGRTDGRLQSQHASDTISPIAWQVAIHPAGTHLAVSDDDCVIVFTLPDFQFYKKLGEKGAGLIELSTPFGLCFTDAGTLLIADCRNNRVQHWTLDGTWIASYLVPRPFCVASNGGVVAVGCVGDGVHVLSLESGAVLSKWLDGNIIYAIAAVGATMFAVANGTAEAIDLYTVEGVKKKRLMANTISYGLTASADDCFLLVAGGGHRECVHVFTMDDELAAPSFTTHAFEGRVNAVALYAERVYVLEKFHGFHSCRICAFE